MDSINAHGINFSIYGPKYNVRIIKTLMNQLK